MAIDGINVIDVQDARFKQEGRAALESLQNLVRSGDGWTLDRSTVSVDICSETIQHFKLITKRPTV